MTNASSVRQSLYLIYSGGLTPNASVSVLVAMLMLVTVNFGRD